MGYLLLYGLFTVTHKPSQPQLQQVSRLAVVLGMGWLLATVLLSAGAHSEFSHMLTLRLWLINGFVGTGYFVTDLWLMLRISRGKTAKLPGISQLSRRLLD